jgi:3-isopropylmalate/(R)-2-methylmalate dehydratase small subunit
MEIAATVILAAGIKAVIAESFARTFYRNAINNGLIPVECQKSGIIEEGEALSVALDEGAAIVTRLSTGATLTGAPMPEIMLRILEAGGLVAYLRGNGGKLRA